MAMLFSQSVCAHEERNGPPVPAKVFLKVSLDTAIEMATHFSQPICA